MGEARNTTSRPCCVEPQKSVDAFKLEAGKVVHEHNDRETLMPKGRITRGGTLGAQKS